MEALDVMLFISTSVSPFGPRCLLFSGHSSIIFLQFVGPQRSHFNDENEGKN